MSSLDTREEISRFISQTRITNTHCHHLDDALYKDIGLRDVLERSYAAWCAEIPDIFDIAAADGFIKKARCNTFFRWLARSIEALYSLPFTAENFPAIDARIRAAHADEAHHLNIMTDICRFESIINERQPNPGSNLGHPRLFKPSFRCDSLFSGFDKDLPDNDGFFCAALFHGGYPETLRDFLTAAAGVIKEKKADGCVALKVAMAYIRPINFDFTDFEKAEKAFGNSGASACETAAFGNVLMHSICGAAVENGLPVQIHTGMAALEGTRPLELLNLIKSHPETKFHLLHGGFPWFSDTYALLASFKNVWSDVCWVPYLSTSRAADYIVTALEVSGSDRLTWGCDAWMPEDSYGALLAMEHTLSKALSQMVSDGAFDINYAKYLAGRIMRENGKLLFGI
ncbi:MAG: amidohydrolase family protein [Clostridiales bacterium]|jgi:hypothetical protein|nr:amidohydrolase family protein [Clostridiales bacterium]